MTRFRAAVVLFLLACGVLTVLTGPSAFVLREGLVVAQPLVVGPFHTAWVVAPFVTLFSIQFRIHKKVLAFKPESA